MGLSKFFRITQKNKSKILHQRNHTETKSLKRTPSYYHHLPNIDNLPSEFDISKDEILKINDVAKKFMECNKENVFVHDCQNSHHFAKDYIKKYDPESSFTVMNFGHILRRIEKFLSEISCFQGKAFFNLDRANEVYLLKLLDYVGIEICITSFEQFDLITKTDIEFNQIIENTTGRVRPYIERLNAIVKTITISDMNNFKIIEDVSDKFNLLLNINLDGNDVEAIGVLPDEIDLYFTFCKEIDQKFNGIYFYPKRIEDFDEIEKIIKKAKDEYEMVLESIYIGNNFISDNIEKRNITSGEGKEDGDEKEEEEENKELENRLKEICEKYNLVIYCDCSDYILNNSCYLYCEVAGKRIRENQNYVYLNDGLYGTLHEMLYKMEHIDVETLHENCNKIIKTTLFGPTCDSIDTIAQDLKLCDLDIGDWISITGNKFCPNTLTYFNSFDASIILYLFC